MAKKKDKPVIEKPEYTEFDSVDALTDEEKDQRDNATFHATFTPTWRPEIDCGDHDSVEAAKQAVDQTFKEITNEKTIESAAVALGLPETRFHIVHFKWQQLSDTEWIATGHDGQVETNMTIATITQVG